MQITVEIPDDIALRLEPLKDKLPQILALGLQEITANPATGFSGLTEILEFFAKLPSDKNWKTNFAAKICLIDKHAIAVAVKTIALIYRVMISVKD